MGYFELADQGTLFLDEIGDMPLEIQAKMLRVLEDRHISPVGSTAEIQVDVRVLSATNVDLENSIAEGSFRQDLYFRLARFPVRVATARLLDTNRPRIYKYLEEQKDSTPAPG